MIARRILMALLCQILAVGAWAQDAGLVTRLNILEANLAPKTIRAGDPNRLSDLLTVKETADSLGVSFPFSGGDNEIRLCNRFDLRTRDWQISCRIVIKRPGTCDTFEFYLFGVFKGEEASDFYCKSVAKLGQPGWVEQQKCHDEDIEWVIPGAALSNGVALVSRIDRILGEYSKYIDLRILDTRPASGFIDQLDRIENRQRVHEAYLLEAAFQNPYVVTCDRTAIDDSVSVLGEDPTRDLVRTLVKTCLENLRQHLLKDKPLELIRHYHSRRICDNVTFTTDGPGDFEVRCRQLQQDTGRTDDPHYEPWNFSLIVKDGEVDEQCWNWKPINMRTEQQADTSTPLENCDGGFVFVW